MRNKAIEPEKPKTALGRTPSRDNQKQEFKEFYARTNIEHYLFSLLADGYNQFNFIRTADSLRRDISTLKRRVSAEGIGFIAGVLPSLMTNLLAYLEKGISDYPGWKLTPGREYPAFMQQFFAQIYESKTDETDRARAIDVVYQVTCAFKKLKGPYRNSVLRKQLADFVQTDMELNKIDFLSDANLRVVSETARHLCRDILKDLDVDYDENSKPRPGPGATNTPTEKHLRFRPHVLYTQLDNEFPYEEWFYSHPWDIVTGAYKHPFRLEKAERPTSRFKFVPKTYGKPRGICIEQLETQFLQQAVKNSLVRRIETHIETRGKINFSSQKVNGDLALVSSSTLEYATIDMKEASDRISRRLMSWLLQDNYELREKLLALSTTIVELPDDIKFIKEFPTEKFAPMGSALCFPIMSLVHYALVKAICIHYAHLNDNDSVYVYGDDILVPSYAVQAVYEHLPKFGMKLNENKSFYKSYFRESCGVHAYHGRNITPVYFKHSPNINMTEKECMSLFSTEADLFRKGFFKTAQLLRAELRAVNRWFKFLPYVPAKSPITGFIRDSLNAISHSDVNWVRRRFNSDYACYEYKVWVWQVYLEDLPPMPQDEMYLRWMLTQNDSTAEQASGHVKGLLQKFTTRAVWLPESALSGTSTEENWGFANAYARHTCRKFAINRTQLQAP